MDIRDKVPVIKVAIRGANGRMGLQAIYASMENNEDILARAKNKELREEVERELESAFKSFTMARSQMPNSANSQFFICFDDARFLDKQYTVWGKVTSGMENVDKIKRGEPVQNPDKIVKAHIASDAA